MFSQKDQICLLASNYRCWSIECFHSHDPSAVWHEMLIYFKTSFEHQSDFFITQCWYIYFDGLVQDRGIPIANTIGYHFHDRFLYINKLWCLIVMSERCHLYFPLVQWWPCLLRSSILSHTILSVAIIQAVACCTMVIYSLCVLYTQLSLRP